MVNRIHKSGLSAVIINRFLQPLSLFEINLSEVLIYMKNKIIKQSALIILLILTLYPLQAASIINESFLKKINTAGDETSCAMTENRKLFIFARKPSEKNDSDLYITEFKNGKWTEASAAADLNSDSDELTPYISPDGKFILFSSNRPGSLKYSTESVPSYDIYFSEKQTGRWTKPELLFGAVNTRDNEFNPYITKEGNQLYITRARYNDSSRTTIIKINFTNEAWEGVSTAEISRNIDFDIYMYSSSTSRPGAYISGFKKGVSTSRDIFYSDNSENRIMEIISSSGPVNTTADEISVSELSKNLIIVSSDAAGNFDFYIKKISPDRKKDLPVKKQPPKTFYIKVESENYKDTAGIKFNILYFSSLKKDSWPVRTEMMSPDSSGMISITADPDSARILVLPGDSGMKPFSVEFLTKNNNITTSSVKIEPSAEKEFSAKPVYFNFNSAELQAADIPYIHQLIEHLRKNESLQISLEGYSDGIGTYKSNLDVSIRRAEKLKEYIVKAGIKKNRIQTKGFGYINDNNPGTSQNRRRVETIIITR